MELAAALELAISVDGDEGSAMVVATGVVLTSTELELGAEGAADPPPAMVYVADVEAATEDSGAEELAGAGLDAAVDWDRMTREVAEPELEAAADGGDKIAEEFVGTEPKAAADAEDEISGTGVGEVDENSCWQVVSTAVAAAVLESTDAGGNGIGLDVSSGWVLVYEELDEADAGPNTRAVEGDPVVAGGVSVSTLVEFGEESTGLPVPEDSRADTLLAPYGPYPFTVRHQPLLLRLIERMNRNI